MLRTNIYLEERQTAALDRLAQQKGVTRAEVIRRLVDAGLAAEREDLARDLDAITASFAVLVDDEWEPRRVGTAREAHLEGVWGR